MPEASRARVPRTAGPLARTWLRTPLRLRVAVAFAGSAALALACLGLFVYLRVDHALAEQRAATLRVRLQALAAVDAAARPGAVRGLGGPVFAEMLREGHEVARSEALARPVPLPVDLRAPAQLRSSLVEVRVVLRHDDEPERATVLVRRVGGQTLVVGATHEAAGEALGSVVTALGVGGALALGVAGGLGYLVAGAALAPIETMRRRAASISASSSHARLPVPPADDEVHALGRTLNEMLDRLDDGLHAQRRFVAEASHELRTPLSLLRLELDLAAHRPTSDPDLHDTLSSVREEVDRLTGLTDSLLLLASEERRPAAGAAPPAHVPTLFERVAARFGQAAAEQHRRVVVDCPDLWVAMDEPRVDRAISNLVDNALRHGSATVVLGAASTPEGDVVLSVADGGPRHGGLGPTTDHVGRFVRGAEARAGSQARPGHGLGLSIAEAVARAHGGRLEVTWDEDAGTRVALVLPQSTPGP